MTLSANYTAAGTNFDIPASETGTTDISGVVFAALQALEEHDHSSTRGLPVARVAATSAVTITTSVANTGLTITNTDAGASGVKITGYHNSATPAVDDTLLSLTAKGKDSDANETEYAFLNGKIGDPASGSEDGYWRVSTLKAGVLTTRVDLGSGTAGVDIRNGALVLGATDGYIELTEMTAPTGTADRARIYAVVDGGGKTDLAAIFQSGAAQVFAQEP